MINALVLMLALALPTAPEEPVDPAPKMVKKVVEQFDCDADTTTLDFLRTERVVGWEFSGWQVNGCGEPFSVAMGFRRGVWTFGASDRALRKRAPFDLSCDADQVTYTYIDYQTRGVRGCERQLTYLFHDGKWIANSSLE